MRVHNSICCFILFFLLLFFPYNEVSAATYYVDATTGSDADDGLSEANAWQTVNKVNTSSFSPGDQILFKKGEIWRESLVVPSSGASGNPITFGNYGTGNNPKIYRSTNYDDWWEHSVLINGGFEYYTGTPDDGVADSVPEYSLLPQTGDVVEIVSDARTGSAAMSVNKVNANNFGSWFRQDIAVSGNTQYYFEYWGKKDATAYLRMQIRDTGNNLYLQDNGTWSSTNNYLEVLDVTSTDWEMKSITFTTDPATTTLDFRFHNYIGSGSSNTGQGRNYVDDIYLIQGSTHSTTRIWAGYIPSMINSWGLVDEAVRVPYHTQYSGINPLNMTAGYFFHKLNDVYFHYRHDSGIPDNTEVGTRKYGIYITGKSYVTVNGIDVIGIGGKNETGSTTFHAVMIDASSSNITMKNMEIRYSGQDGYGIHADNTTTNITYDALVVHDHGSTGIYMNGTGVIQNSYAYNNGIVATDVGDRSGIGSFQSPGITIQDNFVFGNAQPDTDADFDLSVVGATGPAYILRNHVYNCYQGCIQISEGGEGSVIAYNIVRGFGTSTGVQGSNGKFSGIRIGGGAVFSGVPNISILNNLITGGAAPSGSNVQSGIYARFVDTTGLTILNNIFYQNNTYDIYIHNTVPNVTRIDNNNYYRTDYTNAFHWKSTNASSLSAWQSASGQDPNALVLDPLFVNAGAYEFQLTANSPMIDRGTQTAQVLDYARNSVPQGSGFDIGPYERIYIAPTPRPVEAFQLMDPGQSAYISDVRPTFRWHPSTKHHLSKYRLEIDNGATGDIVFDNIPASSNSPIETDKYLIQYENWNDGNDENDAIAVFIKDHDSWSREENRGELKEGKRMWHVTAFGNDGTTNTMSRELFVDRSNPVTTMTLFNNKKITSNSLISYTSKPHLIGRVTDMLYGEHEERLISSGPRRVYFTIRQYTSPDTYKIIQSEMHEFETQYFLSSNAEVLRRSENFSSKYHNFDYTFMTAIPNGSYRLVLESYDVANNKDTYEIPLKVAVSSGTQIAQPTDTVRKVTNPPATPTSQPQTQGVTEKRELIPTQTLSNPTRGTPTSEKSWWEKAIDWIL